ncbi:MAG TPA: hypothetical protein VMF61_00520 [Candidatus Acidoferrales bacterium]|nr:hypothetical protein [Candidatus Acidoferrales bacterium]
MVAAVILSAVLLAQAMPPAAAPAPAMLDTGPCLDSRPVPAVLQPPLVRSMQIVRIDKVESTATMMPGEIVGFLYTLQDGSTWLGQRDDQYMSGAAAAAVNNVLASTHMPGQNVSKFPPQMKHGVATKYTQFYRVQIPPTAFEALRITLVPCVAWPPSRQLPDPNM